MNDSADPTVPLISRREALQRVTVLLGGAAFVSAAGLLAAHEKANRPIQEPIGKFTPDDIAFLDEIAETILPQTSTPGAKAARTGAFMALMVTDSYRPAQQQVFHDGMREVDEATRRTHGISFMMASAPQRTTVLVMLDHEQKRVMDAREAAAPAETPAHFFRMMKQLALLGYYTSEVGCTQALRYVESPGRFDPCIPYTAGEPAWAAHA
jgi:hypothetical protein